MKKLFSFGAVIFVVGLIAGLVGRLLIPLPSNPDLYLMLVGIGFMVRSRGTEES